MDSQLDSTPFSREGRERGPQRVCSPNTALIPLKAISLYYATRQLRDFDRPVPGLVGAPLAVVLRCGAGTDHSMQAAPPDQTQIEQLHACSVTR